MLGDRAYDDTYYVVANVHYLAVQLAIVLVLWAIWRGLIVSRDPSFRRLGRYVVGLYALGAALAMGPLLLHLSTTKPAAALFRVANTAGTLGGVLMALAFATTLAILIYVRVRKPKP